MSTNVTCILFFPDSTWTAVLDLKSNELSISGVRFWSYISAPMDCQLEIPTSQDICQSEFRYQLVSLAGNIDSSILLVKVAPCANKITMHEETDRDKTRR